MHNCKRFGQLQAVRTAETLQSSHRPHGKLTNARCLQGGGVYVYSGTVPITGGLGQGGFFVYSGTVTITSSSIYGNTANYVHAHAQKFPCRPHGRKRFTFQP
jgi:hypothetical protein